MEMEGFLTEWESDYKKKAAAIPLFTDAAKGLNKEQRARLARLLYHQRGHFDHFLFIVGQWAPSPEYRAIVLRNISDELGGLDPTHLSHEELFLRFARELEPKILEEAIMEKSYLPFLVEFNAGHFRKLLESDWDGKWSIFSAYELLDNTDYENLYALGKRLGLAEDKLEFQKVHMQGTHFSETFDLLNGIWEKNPEAVKKGFDFIGKHQLDMWQKVSDEVFAEA